MDGYTPGSLRRDEKVESAGVKFYYAISCSSKLRELLLLINERRISKMKERDEK